MHEEINKKDYNDMNREVNHLRIDKEAIVVDTTEINIDDVVAFVKSLIEDKESKN